MPRPILPLPGGLPKPKPPAPPPKPPVKKRTSWFAPSTMSTTGPTGPKTYEDVDGHVRTSRQDDWLTTAQLLRKQQEAETLRKKTIEERGKQTLREIKTKKDPLKTFQFSPFFQFNKLYKSPPLKSFIPGPSEAQYLEINPEPSNYSAPPYFIMQPTADQIRLQNIVYPELSTVQQVIQATKENSQPPVPEEQIKKNEAARRYSDSLEQGARKIRDEIRTEEALKRAATAPLPEEFYEPPSLSQSQPSTVQQVIQLTKENSQPKPASDVSLSVQGVPSLNKLTLPIAPPTITPSKPTITAQPTPILAKPVVDPITYDPTYYISSPLLPPVQPPAPKPTQIPTLTPLITPAANKPIEIPTKPITLPGLTSPMAPAPTKSIALTSNSNAYQISMAPKLNLSPTFSIPSSPASKPGGLVQLAPASLSIAPGPKDKKPGATGLMGDFIPTNKTLSLVMVGAAVLIWYCYK